MHTHTLSLQKIIHAPLSHLWRSWADADELARWFTDEATVDFRVGGRYANSDGDTGEYLEIVPEELIRFTWEQPDYAEGGVVTVRFRAISDEVSEMILEHDGIACDDEADLRAGWTMSVDALVKYLEE